MSCFLQLGINNPSFLASFLHHFQISFQSETVFQPPLYTHSIIFLNVKNKFLHAHFVDMLAFECVLATSAQDDFIFIIVFESDLWVDEVNFLGPIPTERKRCPFFFDV